MALVQRRLYLVCYDICGERSERRLRRVYRTLRGFGEHIQYSVFRCVLTDRQLAELEGRLEAEIDPTRDQVLFVPLGRVPLGLADAPDAWEGWTLGTALVAPERVVRIVGSGSGSGSGSDDP